MNKTELVKAIAANASLSQVDAKKALDAALDAIAGELKKGEKVALLGFGTFAVNERRSPARKTEISLPLPLDLHVLSL